ncbi:hypothetical protein G9U51_14840 [Calidifontibacter sp. DB0510]|uniref:DUF11 domain-containing protein n=1 Tax=Metallococcus carri TaxID=1656884 RepID=A0A967EB85_9MICO|nr:hypothetical protein [Metallococcus carri]NHN57045.1 hypothetical protein [Metallococcus carri]NOP39086.1 hypothetical protein [Calidifontibacter sp. DB2511S]
MTALETPRGVSRRTVAAGIAWSAPFLVAGSAAQAATCSVTDRNYYSTDLKITSTTTTNGTNGHTVGTFTLQICNNGTLPIPAGTSYTIVLTALKAPGNTSGDKDIVITPAPPAGYVLDPATGTTLNPTGTNTSVTYTATTTTPIAPNSCTNVVFNIDTATGIGATKLQMDATLKQWGGGTCSYSAPGSQDSLTGLWGKDAT